MGRRQFGYRERAESSVEWTRGVDRGEFTALIAQPEPPIAPRRRISEGRPDMLRDVEVADERRKRQEPAEGSKRY